METERKMKTFSILLCKLPLISLLWIYLTSLTSSDYSLLSLKYKLTFHLFLFCGE